MGQAFRRAAGKIQSSNVESTLQIKKVGVQRPAPAVKLDKVGGERTANKPVEEPGMPDIKAENVLEERDHQYDVMLNQMLGRVKVKPGGKMEMGEAVVVEKYNRPMPKLRNTKSDPSKFEETPAPSGTLNVAQLRQIFLLHQGKADDHSGPMDIPQIAAKFKVNTLQIQNILNTLSLPPEASNKQSNTNQ